MSTLRDAGGKVREYAPAGHEAGRLTTQKDSTMGFLDDAKAKVGELLSEHSDQVEEYSDQAIEQAGEFAESKGLSADIVDQGKALADDQIGE